MFPGIRHHGRTRHGAHQRRCTTAGGTPCRVYSPADRVDDVGARSVHPRPGALLQARPRSQQPYPSRGSDGRRRRHRPGIIGAVLPIGSQRPQRRPQVAVRNNLDRQAAPHPVRSYRGGDRSHLRHRAHSNRAPCVRAGACRRSRLGCFSNRSRAALLTGPGRTSLVHIALCHERHSRCGPPSSTSTSRDPAGEPVMPADVFAAVSALVRAEAARRPAPRSAAPLSPDSSHSLTASERQQSSCAPSPTKPQPNPASAPPRLGLLSDLQRRLQALLH